uniref:Activin_recp domain-containing protein n=1 Tax=Haemonchus contortus TaxID=6289 RepID=A0A7I4Y7E2_HAECO
INVTRYSVVRFIPADSLPSDRAIPSGLMQFLLLLLVALSTTIKAKKLTCVRCWDGKCDGECEGDICTLAKHAKTNHTTIAGCKHDRVVEEGPAVCHENYGHIICACSTKDRCNDPASSLSDFKKLDKEFALEIDILPMDSEGGGGDAKGSAGGSESAHSSDKSAFNPMLMTMTIVFSMTTIACAMNL